MRAGNGKNRRHRSALSSRGNTTGSLTRDVSFPGFHYSTMECRHRGSFRERARSNDEKPCFFDASYTAPYRVIRFNIPARRKRKGKFRETRSISTRSIRQRTRERTMSGEPIDDQRNGEFFTLRPVIRDHFLPSPSVYPPRGSSRNTVSKFLASGISVYFPRKFPSRSRHTFSVSSPVNVEIRRTFRKSFGAQSRRRFRDTVRGA